MGYKEPAPVALSVGPLHTTHQASLLPLPWVSESLRNQTKVLSGPPAGQGRVSMAAGEG